MPTSITEQLQLSSEATEIVDCSIHAYPTNEDELVEYLPERFQSKGVFYPEGNWSSPIDITRDDAVPEKEPAGSDPKMVTKHHLDPLEIDHAVITGGGPNLRASTLPETRYAAALIRAYNNWLLDTWLDADNRLHGSISIATNAPDAAAEEIRRLGSHSEMAQVIMGGATQIPLGREKYWPIYEAAVEANLPVAIHVGSEGYGIANPNTGPGYPSTYIERRSVYPANCMGQLLNLMLEGVFVEFPSLQFVIIGGGFSWIPSFVWRIEKAWKGLTHDMPWVDRPPSEYIKDHVRFTSHPLDEPDDPDHLQQILNMLNAEKTLMFSSNYPHWDSYSPGDPLPDLPPALKQSVFSENAMNLYGF